MDFGTNRGLALKKFFGLLNKEIEKVVNKKPRNTTNRSSLLLKRRKYLRLLNDKWR